MRYILSITILLNSLITFSQDYEVYTVKNIPSDLKNNADIVIRDYDLQFEIFPNYKLRQSTYKVITILNESAENEAILIVFYDKFRKVKKFSARILDKNGKVVKKLNKTDIFDASIAQNSVDDSRIKAADMSYHEYPFSVVFNYTVDYVGLFYYPIYIPQYRERMSVEKSTFSINFPPGLEPRFKQLNINLENDSDNSIRWSVSKLAAFEEVPFSPDITDFVPTVLTGPNDFILDGNEGNMSTWDGFAKWYYKLNSDRDKLSEKDIERVKNLTSTLSSDTEKIKAIYEYMQSKTRYVSVQLGIGGYQSMLASYVEENGWGDCKALSNYTMALLKSVNIDAHPALVYAGRNVPDIVSDFPSNQFNHVILCIPLEKDTVWLECTSREMPFDYLGEFTGDRNVLFVDKNGNGGEIIRTPRYGADENFVYRKATVTIDKMGNGKATAKTTYGGLSFDKLLPLLDEPEENLKINWNKNKNITGLNLDRITYKYDKKEGPVAVQHLELSLNKYAKQSGTQFLFHPNILNRRTNYPKKDSDRQHEIVISSEYVEIDTIEFHIPDGFHIEYLPEKVNINTEFGTYSASYEASENGFLYIRKLIRTKGTFPKESYKKLYEMLKKVSSEDRKKIVLAGST